MDKFEIKELNKYYNKVKLLKARDESVSVNGYDFRAYFTLDDMSRYLSLPIIKQVEYTPYIIKQIKILIRKNNIKDILEC